MLLLFPLYPRIVGFLKCRKINKIYILTALIYPGNKLIQAVLLESPLVMYRLFVKHGLPWLLSGKESACQCRRH